VVRIVTSVTNMLTEMHCFLSAYRTLTLICSMLSVSGRFKIHFTVILISQAGITGCHRDASTSRVAAPLTSLDRLVIGYIYDDSSSGSAPGWKL